VLAWLGQAKWVGAAGAALAPLCGASSSLYLLHELEGWGRAAPSPYKGEVIGKEGVWGAVAAHSLCVAVYVTACPRRFTR
jgi:hypothetical protein